MTIMKMIDDVNNSILMVKGVNTILNLLNQDIITHE